MSEHPEEGTDAVDSAERAGEPTGGGAGSADAREEIPEGDGRPPPLDNGAVARALIEAVFLDDLEAALALCSDDLVLRIEGSHSVQGHAGLRQLMEFQAEVSRDVRVEFHEVIAEGDTVAISRTTRMVTLGVPVEIEVGAFLTVRAGRVVEWIDHQDLREVRRALGY